MKERKFDEKINIIYNNLTEKNKNEYRNKEDKYNKVFLVIGITLATITLAAFVSCIVMCIIDEDYRFLILICMLEFLLELEAIWIILSSYKKLKALDEIKIKNHIVRLETQKEIKRKQEEEKLQKNVYYRLAVEKIKTVSILDSYTEVSDKLHAVLNFQEIIQKRVYKFKVEYNNGTSKIITAAEGSEEYSILISRVNSSAANQTNSEDNKIEMLREYKKLLDEGIITQEEFEAKKQKLLSS